MNKGFSPQAAEGIRRAQRRVKRQRQVIWGIIILCVIIYILSAYVWVKAEPDCPDDADCRHPRPTVTAVVTAEPEWKFTYYLPIIEAHKGWLPFDLQSNGSLP